jgi:hypothetical protein
VTEEQPEVVVRGTIRQHEEQWIVSLFLVNGQREPKIRRDEAWIFQPELTVTSPDGSAIFRQRPSCAIQAARTLSPTMKRAPWP